MQIYKYIFISINIDININMWVIRVLITSAILAAI